MSNFDKFNNIVQVILNKAISMAQTLPADCLKEQQELASKERSKEDAQLEEPTEELPDNDTWTMDEKDKLFNFVSRVFLMNFPVYIAYKHTVQTNLDDLPPQESAALNNYCEITVRSI